MPMTPKVARIIPKIVENHSLFSSITGILACFQAATDSRKIFSHPFSIQIQYNRKMTQQLHLCKLRYLSRGLHLALLCYLCLVQFAAPLVHAHSITSDSLKPEGLHYLHPYGVPPSSLAALLTSTCENIEVGISTLKVTGSRTERHLLMKPTLPKVDDCAQAKTAFSVQTRQTCYVPVLFYYSCAPRSPPKFS